MLRSDFQPYFRHLGEFSNFDQNLDRPLIFRRNMLENTRRYKISLNIMGANMRISNLDVLESVCVIFSKFECLKIQSETL